MKTTCTITWPDGSEVTAVHRAAYPNVNAKVEWSGTLGKLEDPPQRTASYVLEAYLDHQAELAGASIVTAREGTWPAIDSVV